jgi:hypothetical protein
MKVTATRKMRWANYVARMGRTMNLFAKHENYLKGVVPCICSQLMNNEFDALNCHRHDDSCLPGYDAVWH